MLGLLRKASGATLQEIRATTGWQAHTVRGFVSKVKAAGFSIQSDKVAGVRTYRIISY